MENSILGRKTASLGKKWIVAILCMATILSNITPISAEETGAFMVDGQTYSSLQDAIDIATSTLDRTVMLIANAEIEEGITVETIGGVNLDLNGYELRTTENFTGDLFTVYTPFSISNGTIDMSKSKDVSSAFNNHCRLGTSTVTNCYIIGNANAIESVGIDTRNNARTVLDGVDINSFTTGISTIEGCHTTIINSFIKSDKKACIYNEGITTIENSDIESTLCDKCSSWYKEVSDENEKVHSFGYAIVSAGGTLRINSGEITGVHGALAAVGGNLQVNGGAFTTKECPNHPQGSTSHYALYVAGEKGGVTASIDGGDFTSCSKSAVKVGNMDNDGGLKEHSTCIINVGTFRTYGGSSVEPISVEKNGELVDNGATIETPDILDFSISETVEMTSDPDGNLIAAPITIENHDETPIKLSDFSISTENGWQIVEECSNPGAKELSLMINGQNYRAPAHVTVGAVKD